MTRSIAFSLAVLASIFLSVSAQAAGVPHYVNFQSVLRDDSGNLVTDDFIDIQIKVLDQDKDVVYEETQPGVQVVRGAINVMIGEGLEPGSSPSTPTGGIPTSAVDPEKGSHFLQVQFGSNLPSDGMELGSVPYAMYAEVALGLAPNIPASAIPGNFATDEELAAAIQAHENDTTAHPASSITTVDEFDNSNGANAQDVLDDLDQAITDEEGARASGDSGLQGQIDGKVNRSGDTMTGVLNFDAGSGETARIEPGTGNILTPGTVDGVDVSSLNSTVTVNHENRITALETNDPGSSPILQYPNDSSREYASGQTVGSSPVVIYSKTLDGNSAYILRATVAILNSSQSICRNYTRDGLMRRAAAGAIEVSDDQTHAYGPGSPRVEWQVSGNAAQLVAIGAAGETVNYNGWIESIKVANP